MSQFKVFLAGQLIMHTFHQVQNLKKKLNQLKHTHTLTPIPVRKENTSLESMTELTYVLQCF